MKRSSALRDESNQTGSNLYEQVDDREESNMEQPELFKFKPPKSNQRKECHEYKVLPANECRQPDAVESCDTSKHVTDHLQTCVGTTPQSVRILKIEEDGDFWKGKINPKIRLKGHWLERAGFKPGNHVSVRSVAPGLIELCSQ